MDAEARICYYLGANAPSGFYSLYDQLIDPEQARDVRILKGGPGCGKSTLMKQVGTAMEEAGLTVEYVRCSGDPDSLDAIVIPAIGAAVVDGTAPHGGATEGHPSKNSSGCISPVCRSGAAVLQPQCCGSAAPPVPGEPLPV